MGKAELATANDAVEWLNWDQTMRLLQAAKVGLRPYDVLVDWCREGLVETKAALVTGGGNVRRDADLDTKLWDLCIYEGGAALDPMDGSIRWHHRDPDTKKPSTLSVVGTQFRKEQVLSLVSHLDESAIIAALTAEGEWLGSKKKSEPTPAEVPKVESNRGRRADAARWQAFWFTVIGIAQEQRLNHGCFNSASALVDEIQELMGKGAFDRDYIKPTVGQIYKKFIGG